MTFQKNIKYPTFIYCLKYLENDLFWKNIFEDLIYGKTPLGFFINKDIIYTDKKDDSFPLTYLSQNFEHFCKDLISFFSQKIKSVKLIHTNIKIQNWASIRKKAIKDMLVESFVLKMKYQHDLTIEQTRYLKSILLIAILFKILNINDIIIEHNCIQSIKGIVITKNKIDLSNHLFINKKNFNLIPVVKIIQTKQSFAELWVKFLKFYDFKQS